MPSENVSFHDLPVTAFPLTMQLVHETTGAVLWSTVMTGAGMVKVPGLGQRVFARLIHPDGTVFEEGPIDG